MLFRSVTSELIANGTAGLHRFVELMRTQPTLTDIPNALELNNVTGKIDINQSCCVCFPIFRIQKKN